MAAPSWLATQPPTAIMSDGLSCFRCLIRPRSANTFSWAFSRTEQVLKTMRSAWSAHAAVSSPSALRMTSAILPESYSFIWQPNVRTKSLATAASVPLVGLRGFLRREEPHLAYEPFGIHHIFRECAGRDRGGDDDEIRCVADLGAWCESALGAVDGDRHALHVAHLAALRILRERAHLGAKHGREAKEQEKGERADHGRTIISCGPRTSASIASYRPTRA